MAPPETSAASSNKTKQSSSKTSKPSQSKKESETASTSTPRQPDEIEEADTTVPVETFTPKQKQKRVESSEDNDTDDAESVYLSSDEEETSSEEDSSDYDSDDSVQELPPRHLTRRATDRSVKNTPGSPFTITQTRSETTRWITTQNNGGMTRGTRSYSEQTTMQGQNMNGPQRRPMNRNSVSFNMSINVDMSFNGLVTGRNLGFSGGSLSYGWNRRSAQGG